LLELGSPLLGSHFHFHAPLLGLKLHFLATRLGLDPARLSLSDPLPLGFSAGPLFFLASSLGLERLLLHLRLALGSSLFSLTTLFLALPLALLFPKHALLFGLQLGNPRTLGCRCCLLLLLGSSRGSSALHCLSLNPRLQPPQLRLDLGGRRHFRSDLPGHSLRLSQDSLDFLLHGRVALVRRMDAVGPSRNQVALCGQCLVPQVFNLLSPTAHLFLRMLNLCQGRLSFPAVVLRDERLGFLGKAIQLALGVSADRLPGIRESAISGSSRRHVR
jgi:hypothetical protein